MTLARNNGFQEVVGIVGNPAATADRLCRLFDYQIIWKGEPDPAMIDLLGVDPDWRGAEILVGDPAQRRGYIRLIGFPGRTTGVMRDGAQPWDCGGIFDINIRALAPIETLHAKMIASGFCAFGPLTAWDFGPLAVKQAVYRDGDGLAVALMERIAPSLTGFEAVAGGASYVFNSTQVVPDIEAAVRLFRDGLGWQSYQDSRWRHDDGRNCMGLPPDLARSRELRAAIYHPFGLNEGSVELLHYAGEKLDFSTAAPPDRGWASLRFPVDDVAGFLMRAEHGGCAVRAERSGRIEPYGAVRAGAAVTPWGARLEVYTPGFR